MKPKHRPTRATTPSIETAAGQERRPRRANWRRIEDDASWEKREISAQMPAGILL
ncbi:hypothetical protein GLOTRDRAFT_112716 [Gloeophyllum trabeum ATCC 11539]|uniref:Uncharacterized protein n=1 Tax=Gloeophyllum trabeum (strain ATCC 11539 / FP-39264 / Madison 617) TaxID=670483 RepID=S7R7W2_GLOTA|nr:uncharacterized protein GLOTRDRAFT_112716 [Gloeophyllum trabeum ATCC 11539]EPQ50440.1 hypothetical protein GLOTRDRAFT_112716 [Gloeophyllum trabeum ATCC 11539]